MRLNTFNLKIPQRINITSKWWFKPFLKKKHHIVYVAGGELYTGYFSNEQLNKLYLTSVTIINASWGSYVTILGD